MGVLDVKRIADSTFGNLNKGVKRILEVFDTQNKNMFEIVLYPAPPKKFGIGTLKTLGLGALDSTLTKIYVQSISCPFLKFEYESYQEVKEIKDLTYPEQMSITFVENELGFVRLYIKKWFEQIVKVDSKDPNSYVFQANQAGAKKNGAVIPLMGTGLPSLPLIKFYGLKPMGIQDIEFSQAEGDPMLITVDFSVDNVWLNYTL
jgi:hypothetical protein